jgi:PAS domain-containing protein
VYSSFEPAVILGADRRVVYANPAAGELFGVDARRLRRQKLPLPLEHGRGSRVELSDAAGRTHDLEIRSMEVRWRDEPAHLVLMRSRVRAGHMLDRPRHHASMATLASELHAHAHRLEAWIRQAADHQRKLADLGRWIGRPGRASGVSICRAQSRRTMAELVDDTRGALGEAADDLERVRRLSTRLQRMSGQGRTVELHTLDALVRHACESVRRECASEARFTVETGAPGMFPRDASRTTAVMHRLLNALVSIARQEVAAPLDVVIRTRATGDSATISLQVEGASAKLSHRVLAGLVKTTESAPELELAHCIEAIRDMGGHARFGTGPADSVWLELSVVSMG